jgi:hypothetical protein
LPSSEENRCPACGGALEPRELAEFGGEADGVGVAFFGLRGLSCSHAAHPRRPPYADFGADLASEILYGDSVPSARKRGIVRKRWTCGRCGSDLDSCGTDRGELRSRIRLPRAAPFTLTLDMCLARCGACRQTQVVPTRERRRQLEQAIFAALAAAERAALARES